METETDRLFQLACREGIGSAIDYAQRTLAIYTAALATPKHFSALPQYRPSFEAAIETYKKLLAGQIQL